MIEDRQPISQGLDMLVRRTRGGARYERLQTQLGVLQKRLQGSIQRKERRLLNTPTIVYPEHLPIFAKKDAIVNAIRRHQVVIVSGDTGSGKSTQIPKMCLEAGQGIAGKIGCTQPRRIAATTIARRIAEEMSEVMGNSIGYKIRFAHRIRRDAYIKVVTDGMLLAEAQQDPFLYEYDTLMIDEAHERSVNIDLLLGILKTLLPQRNELKVIITSATIDTEKFSAAFDAAPVIEVEGRMYPVAVEYMPMDPELENSGEVTYVDTAVRAVEALRKKKRLGDILIFMPTEQDIRETCELLEARHLPRTNILPLFARLTAAQQKRVFADFPGQKIVVATNVAETSLTIPGIKYVIDTGLARIPRYLPRTRTTSLPISPISISSADQRKGRCGRMESGICIRLFSEEDYASRPQFNAPEILRSNLAEVIIRMLSLNMGNISSFPFVDKPNPKSIKDGLDRLKELGAIVRGTKGFSLTEKGRIMARLPMDPQISRMMLEAKKEGCVSEVAVIAAALSIQDPRERPIEKAAQADQMHAPFKDPESDFITLLNIWNRYHKTWGTLKTQNKMRKFCNRHFLSFVRMREWRDIHEQITRILGEHGIKADTVRKREPLESRYAGIHRAILSGYLSNIATKKEKNIYLAAKGREVMIFPGSTLFNRGRTWIVAAEVVKTSQRFARTVARIEPHWLEDLGGSLCRSSYSEPHWEKNRGEVRAFEQVKLYGLVIVTKRSVSYGPIDPEASHKIFIQSALVEGQMKSPLPFLIHNQDLVKGIGSFEDKVRRRDFLASEQAMAEFYSKKLPGIYDVRSLKRHIKERGSDEFLKMREEDVLLSQPDASVLEMYPDKLTLGDHIFRLSYKFTPVSEEDGVTVKIPSTFASSFPAEKLEWVVPGLLKEKITALIKGLPKRIRKQLIPVSRTADIIAAEMEVSNEPLITALSRFIYRRFGVDIPASEWSTDGIPDHLKMRVSLTNHEGREIHGGRDFHRLRERVKPSASRQGELAVWKKARKKWERSGITSWDFGDLPAQISLAPQLAAYPALSPEKHGVNIVLFQDADQALESHKKGLEALFCFHLKKDLKFLKRILVLPEELEAATVYFGGPRRFQSALYETLIHQTFNVDIRTQNAFHAHAEAVRPILVSSAKGFLAQINKVLRAFHETRSALHAIETANRSNEGIQALCAVIRADVAHLLPTDFLARYSPDQLEHLPRYLKAMKVRAERGAYNAEKDKKKAAAAEGFVEAFEEMMASLSPHTSREKREALDAYRWMIEEFKVSLFAPELKTAYPVSQKRLETKLGEIQRMV